MKITKQKVQAVADLKAGYTLGHADVAILNELARIALASLEAEPVAYVDPFAFNNFSVYRAGETDNKRMGREWMWANPDAGLIPVYTAPPAPVSVPDESAVELLATDLMKRIDKITGERHSVATLSSLRVSIVEACRASMLQGAENDESPTTMHTAPALDSSPKIAESTSGNSPVIPDGWVACSEQMPHIGVPVITCCGDVVQYAAYAWDGKEWQDWYEEYDKLPANTFTHWHPRPAAPQQEAKNV